MPLQPTKIEHLPRDASAILRERYLAGSFSVVTQCFMGELIFHHNFRQIQPSYNSYIMNIISRIKAYTFLPFALAHESRKGSARLYPYFISGAWRSALLIEVVVVLMMSVPWTNTNTGSLCACFPSIVHHNKHELPFCQYGNKHVRVHNYWMHCIAVSLEANNKFPFCKRLPLMYILLCKFFEIYISMHPCWRKYIYIYIYQNIVYP